MKNIIEDIKMELTMLKVNTELQDEQVAFYIKQVKQKILNITNLEEAPKQLEYIIAKRAVGEILNTLVSSNALVVNGEAIQSVEVSSITRGDVSMTYKGTSTSDTFKKLITSYSEYGQDEILKYRVIKWI